jgi:hypothetical protein
MRSILFFVTKNTIQSYNSSKALWVRDSVLSGKNKLKKYNLGWIIGSIGVGIIITFIIPVWGWMIAVGGGLIYVGWYIIDSCHH